MPRYDGTGPEGQGPMTGRGRGYCASYDAPGYANPMPGWGPDMGGKGGWRRWFRTTGLPRWTRSGCASWGAPWDEPPAVSRQQETEVLKAQAEWLQRHLAAVNKRIEALEKE
jgi:hypothetical protein